jgi:hypothetical protein
MSEAKVTTEHEAIRRWAEERHGTPAKVKGTNGDPAVLRIAFADHDGREELVTISWEEWFRVFDEHELAFLHQEQTAAGKPSRYNRLVPRDTPERQRESEHRAAAHRS